MNRPEPKRDHYGRYLLPDPETGKERPWTRATTFAKTVAETSGLMRWQCRMVAKGVATRPDLYALAASTPIDNKATLDKIAEDAKEAAAASSGANLGTALHAFTEQLDAGGKIVVPAPWDADITAYQIATRTAGIRVDPKHIERIVVVRDLGVAGTLDRIVAVDGRVAIADVKTGKDLSYSWGEIAIQLALYAHADAMWDDGAYLPMPDVSQDIALVIHLPVGRARCDLYEVDIAAGWWAAQMCEDVRTWRSRRDLAWAFHVDALAGEIHG